MHDDVTLKDSILTSFKGFTLCVRKHCIRIYGVGYVRHVYRVIQNVTVVFPEDTKNKYQHIKTFLFQKNFNKDEFKHNLIMYYEI